MSCDSIFETLLTKGEIKKGQYRIGIKIWRRNSIRIKNRNWSYSTFSFPYVKDWINGHPLRNEPAASVIYNQIKSASIHADTLNNIMKYLK